MSHDSLSRPSVARLPISLIVLTGYPAAIGSPLLAPGALAHVNSYAVQYITPDQNIKKKKNVKILKRYCSCLEQRRMKAYPSQGSTGTENRN